MGLVGSGRKDGRRGPRDPPEVLLRGDSQRKRQRRDFTNGDDQKRLMLPQRLHTPLLRMSIGPRAPARLGLCSF